MGLARSGPDLPESRGSEQIKGPWWGPLACSHARARPHAAGSRDACIRWMQIPRQVPLPTGHNRAAAGGV
jgi:hypothetical protein